MSLITSVLADWLTEKTETSPRLDVATYRRTVRSAWAGANGVPRLSREPNSSISSIARPAMDQSIDDPFVCLSLLLLADHLLVFYLSRIDSFAFLSFSYFVSFEKDRNAFGCCD